MLEPLGALHEVREFGRECGVQCRDRQKRYDAHQRTHLHRERAPVREPDDVVEETVVDVPEALAVHCLCDVREVLVELDGDVLVRLVVVGQAERHLEHGDAVHGHPGRTVGLLEDARDR